jgi:AsmA family protein
MRLSELLPVERAMKKGLRRLLLLLAALFGVLIIAVLGLVIFVNVYDWNRARPALSARLSHALDREVLIDGDLHVQWRRDNEGRVHHWLPRINVAAANVTVGNLPWSKQKTFATAQNVEFDIVLWPLLAREIFLGSIHIVEPVAHLERRADGTNSWTLTNSSGEPSLWHLKLGRVVFDSGKFDIDDQVRKLRADIVVRPISGPIDFDTSIRDQEKRALALSSSQVGAAGAERMRTKNTAHPHRGTLQKYAFSWNATGKLSGSNLTASGHVGSVLAFQDDEEPWPIQGEVNTGNTHLAIVGTLKNPTDLSGMDLRLWLIGASMADLYPLLGVALPETARFATDGHVSGELRGQHSIIKYENFNGRVGQSDLSGSMTYDSGDPRPKLSGTIDSRLLQFADLGAVVGAQTKEMDADVEFTGAQIIELPIQNIKTRIVMDKGVLTLKPLHFTVAGGTGDSDIRLDGRTAPIKGSINIAARHLKLSELAPGISTMKASIGEVNGDLGLKANGNSVAELLGDADGEIKMLVDNGTVSKAALETAGLNLANIVITKLFGDEQVKINCAATDFVVDNGVLDSRLFIFDTDEALIRVDGNIDLSKEKLDLTIHPDTKRLRLLSLRSPLRVTGTFKNPDIAVDKKMLLVRGGGAVALGALAPFAALIPLIAPSGGPDNPCAGVIEQMKSTAVAKPAVKK